MSPDAGLHRPSRRSVLAGLATGVAVVAATRALRRSRSTLGALGPSAGTLLGWVADRQGGRVCALDRDLAFRTVVPVPSPRRVVAGRAGAAWVLFGARPVQLGQIACGAGERVEPLALLGSESERLLDLVALGSSRIAVLIREAANAARVVSVDADGQVVNSCSVGAVAWLAASGSRVLAGGAGSGLWLVETSRRAGLRAHERDAEARSAAGAGGHGFWSLDGAGADARLTSWSTTLNRRWTRSVGFACAPVLAPSESTGRTVWLADDRNRSLESFGPRGARGRSVRLPTPSSVRALAAVEDGWILAYAGALLRLDQDGVVRAAQGGFDHLVDLALVRRRSTLEREQRRC